MLFQNVNTRCGLPKVSGFTLLELLITLVIAVLVTVISTAAYSRLSSSAILKNTTQDILVTLRYARNRAISDKRESVFVMDMGSRSYSVAGEKRIRSLDDALAIQVYSARFNQSNSDTKIIQIRFAPDGSSSGGEIKISNNKKSYRISVEWLTGKVELAHG